MFRKGILASIILYVLHFVLQPTAFAQRASPASVPAAAYLTKGRIAEGDRAVRGAFVEGEVATFSQQRKKRSRAIRDCISKDASVFTGKDSGWHLDMEDDCNLSGLPHTKMSVITYQTKGESSEKLPLVLS